MRQGSRRSVDFESGNFDSGKSSAIPEASSSRERAARQRVVILPMLDFRYRHVVRSIAMLYAGF